MLKNGYRGIEKYGKHNLTIVDFKSGKVCVDQSEKDVDKYITEDNMFFSDYFGVSSSSLREYGAVDISLVCDMPLFIDPMLIFNSDKPEYKELHDSIIKYFCFLAQKAKNKLSKGEIKAWFKFSEVKNNWLGYSFSGNDGLALGDAYADYLYENIGFATSTGNISQSAHIEKIMLLHEGSGKDKISDLTVNLIKEYLLEYTQAFAIKNIRDELKKQMWVERAYFNYETECFVSKEYVLPFIVNAALPIRFPHLPIVAPR